MMVIGLLAAALMLCTCMPEVLGADVVVWVTDDSDGVDNRTLCDPLISGADATCNFRSAIHYCLDAPRGSDCQIFFLAGMTITIKPPTIQYHEAYTSPANNLSITGNGTMLVSSPDLLDPFLSLKSRDTIVKIEDIQIAHFHSEYRYRSCITIDALNEIIFGGVVFYNNTSVSDGGALTMYNVNQAVFTNSLFINNSALDRGGAVFIENDKGGGTYFSDCTFSGNEAKGSASTSFGGGGGALYFGGTSDHAVVRTCTFVSNSAVTYGGAIYYQSRTSSTLIKDSEFIDNFAAFSGGALFSLSSGGEFLAYGSTFIGNMAKSSGGATYMYEDDYSVFGQCTFLNNWAELNGGANYYYEFRGSFLVGNFYEGNVARRGGALHYASYGLSATVVNCIFHRNEAEIYGGAIALDFSIIYPVVLDSAFVENDVTDGYGGAIGLFDANYEASIWNCTFVRNTAIDGGAVSALSRNLLLEITDSSFYENSAGSNGGAIYIYFFNGGELIKNNIIERNTANTNGGGIFFYDKNRNFRVEQNVITDNTARGEGGGIFFGSGNTNIVMHSNFLSHNRAGRSGGGVAINYENVNMSIVDCLMTGNIASQGGGVYSALGNSYLLIKQSIFSGNLATQGGGVYFGSNHHRPEIISSTFLTNSGLIGAGLYIGVFNGYVKVWSCRFDLNIAYECASAVYGLSNGMSLKFNDFNSQTEYNPLPNCGVVSLEYTSASSIEYNTFRDNFGFGSLQLFYVSYITVTGNIFIDNTAFTVGGALDISRGDHLTVDANQFIRNEALTGGGAISLVFVSSCVVNDCFFLENSAVTESGGAVSLVSTSGVNISSCNFTSDSANTNGGAIYLEDTRYTTITGSAFNTCRADHGSGSSLYLIETRMTTIMNCSFINNSALHGGGTVLWFHNIEGAISGPNGLDGETNAFERNRAAYGETSATQGYQTRVLIFDDSSGVYYPPVANNLSGTNVSYAYTVLEYGSPLPALRVEVLDFYEHLVVTDDTSITRISVNSDSQECGGETPYITGDYVEDINHGVAEFLYIEVHCIPGGYVDVDIETTYLSFLGSISSFQSTLRLYFRSCLRGEYYSNGDCTVCPEGKFSLEPNEDLTVKECKYCPENADSCIGDDIKVRKGHWRINENSTSILECLRISEGCKGGWEAGDRSCKVGYEGPLCSVCSEEYYFNSATSTCDSCEETSATSGLTSVGVLTVLFIIFILILWVYYIRHTSHNQHVSRKEQVTIDDMITLLLDKLKIFFGMSTSVRELSVEDKKRIHAARKEFRRRLVVKLKIYLTLYQIVSSLSNVLDFGFPDAVQATLSVLRIVNFSVSQGLSVSCEAHYDYISILLVTTLFPIGVSLAICGAYWIHIGYLKRVNESLKGGTENRSISIDHSTDRILLSVKAAYIYVFLFFTYLIFPGVSTVIFQMFSCQNVDEDNDDPGANYYLRADYSVSCESDRYYFGLSWAIVMLFVYPLGIPMFYFYLLYRTKYYIATRNENVDEITGQIRRAALFPLAFLFDAYKPKFWFWEVVEAFQRLFFTGILVCVLPGTTSQVLVAVVFSLFFIKVYDTCDPFTDNFSGFSKNLAQWQYFSVFTIVLSLKSDIIEKENSAWVIFFFFLSIFANAFVDLLFVFQAIYNSKRSGSYTHHEGSCGVTELCLRCFSNFRANSGKNDSKKMGKNDVIEEVEMPQCMKFTEDTQSCTVVARDGN